MSPPPPPPPSSAVSDIPMKKASVFSSPAAERVSKLRILMATHSLDAYIIPSEDAHMSEYVARCDERRAFLTGFTGSAGTALVTRDCALLWTDGRYFVQAEAQLDADVFTLMRMHEDETLEEWALAHLPDGSVIGIDACTASIAGIRRMRAAFNNNNKHGKTEKRLTLKPTTPPMGIPNLVDVVWASSSSFGEQQPNYNATSAKPMPPANPVRVHPVTFSGMDVAQKLAGVRSSMRELSPYAADVLVISGLDEVAWLLNLRGSDVDYNPVFWAYVIVTHTTCMLYTDDTRFLPGVSDHLTHNDVSVRPYKAVFDDLYSIVLRIIVDQAQAQCDGSGGVLTTTMVKDDGDNAVMSEADDSVKGGDEQQTVTDVSGSSGGDNDGGTKDDDAGRMTDNTTKYVKATAAATTPGRACVWLDQIACNYAILDVVEKGAAAAIVTAGNGNDVDDDDDNATNGTNHVLHVEHRQSPVVLAKARKNAIELAGMRACHIRDAVALCRYLAWLDRTIVDNDDDNAETTYDECDVAAVLDGYRGQLDKFISLSFPTISSVGPNGAIIHYSPEKGTSATLSPGDMYLVDSGGQYYDGTTDVTRTVFLGCHGTEKKYRPSTWQKETYTRVLQGHIALDSAVFPQGTTGHLLDGFARRPLWQAGLDYKHGTGHGVGSCLNVHEGPHVISFRPQALDTAMQNGFVTSNEPGYYETGAFGIRLENLCIVTDVTDDDPVVRGPPRRTKKKKKVDEQEEEEEGDRKRFLRLEHVTLVPYQAILIEIDMLSKQEIAWVDKYHAEVREKVGPYLQKTCELAYAWLLRSTRPLAEMVEDE